MPTVIRIGPYRFFFFSNERDEPPHIHVRSGDGEAKFWLVPLELSWSKGYNERQLTRIEQHIRDKLAYFIQTWDKYFGSSQ